MKQDLHAGSIPPTTALIIDDVVLWSS